MPLAVRLAVDGDCQLLTAAAEALTAMNYVLMSREPDSYPPLYESGVRYRREEPGREDWLTADAILAQGYADCEDLAGYRAAELRREGIPARVLVRPTRRGSYHAVVVYPDGDIEDPSRILVIMERSEQHG